MKKIKVMVGLVTLSVSLHASFRVETQQLLPGQSAESVYEEPVQQVRNNSLYEEPDSFGQEPMYQEVGPALPARNGSRDSLDDSALGSLDVSVESPNRISPTVEQQKVGSSKGLWQGMKNLFSSSSKRVQPQADLTVKVSPKQTQEAQRVMLYVESSLEAFNDQARGIDETNNPNQYRALRAALIQKYGPLVARARVVQEAIKGPFAVTKIENAFRANPALEEQIQAIGRLTIFDISLAYDSNAYEFLPKLPDKMLAQLSPPQLRQVFKAITESKDITSSPSNMVIKSLSNPRVVPVLKSLYELVTSNDAACQKAATLVLKGEKVGVDAPTRKLLELYQPTDEGWVHATMPSIEEFIATYDRVTQDV